MRVAEIRKCRNCGNEVFINHEEEHNFCKSCNKDQTPEVKKEKSDAN